MKRLFLCAAILAAGSATADFGLYQGHTLVDGVLVVQSDLGQLRIAPVDDASDAIDDRQNEFNNQQGQRPQEAVGITCDQQHSRPALAVF